MKRRTVTGVALAALTFGGVALAALTAGGVVLGALTAALIASSSPADAGGWGRRGHGRHGYYRGYGGHRRYGRGGGFRLRLVFPYTYGGPSYYGYRRYDPYRSYAAPAPVYTPPVYTPPVYTPPAAAPQTTAGAQPYCREYSGSVTVDGKTVSTYGTACLQSDGTWKIVD